MIWPQVNKGLILTDNTEASVGQRRQALLLHQVGTDVQDIFSALPNMGERTDYHAAVAALNTYFVPQVNAGFSQQTFHHFTQKNGEMILQFVTRLRQAAMGYDFRTDNDNQIRDTILSKCTLDCFRRNLLKEPGLTLASTLDLAAQCDRVEMQTSLMQASALAPTDGPPWKE